MKGSAMKTKDGKISRIEDLVAAAFHGAERYSTDPDEVARLASGVVALILRTGCRRAVLSAVQARKVQEGIRLNWPEDKGREQKTSQVS
jgi:hypothetical protein